MLHPYTRTDLSEGLGGTAVGNQKLTDITNTIQGSLLLVSL